MLQLQNPATSTKYHGTGDNFRQLIDIEGLTLDNKHKSHFLFTIRIIVIATLCQHCLVEQNVKKKPA